MGKLVRFYFDDVILSQGIEQLVLRVLSHLKERNYSEAFNSYIKSKPLIHRVTSTVAARLPIDGVLLIEVADNTKIRKLSDSEKNQVLGEVLIILYKKHIDKDDFEKGGYFKRTIKGSFEQVLTDYIFELILFFFSQEHSFSSQLSASYLSKMRKE